MAYTGTGTQDDPFVVNNWEDFKALAPVTNRWITLDPDAENKVMDLRDTADRRGIDKALTLRANVRGNGWTIRNLVLEPRGYINSNSIPAKMWDLCFENCIFYGKNLFHEVFEMENCRFTVMFMKYNGFLDSLYSSRFTDCAFHFYFAPGCIAGDLFTNCELNGCTVHLRGKWPGGNLEGKSASMENCLVTGELELTDTVLTIGGNALDKNNIFTLKLTGTGTYAETADGYAANLVAIESAADTVTCNIAGQHWHGLTNAQMQDREYLLYTLGFPVAAAEGE